MKKTLQVRVILQDLVEKKVESPLECLILFQILVFKLEFVILTFNPG